jgi:hexosaminidase
MLKTYTNEFSFSIKTSGTDEIRNVDLKSSILDKLERVVHIDLKGAPPKPDYFERFIPLLKDLGATGILLEYEDMFPFEGKLAVAKNGRAYTLNEVNMIKEIAKKNDLYIIPLVQTYGHLEWLLKVKTFAHLRESSQFPQVISPCLSETYTVIYGI